VDTRAEHEDEHLEEDYEIDRVEFLKSADYLSTTLVCEPNITLA